MILNLQHLLLEVTRKCNMVCRHCMRGDAEELSLDDAVINRIFQDTRHIGHLCLTGGEPSLVPHIIKKILYEARRWGCLIDSFFCATNAKVFSQQFADALTDLYGYCKNREHCTLTVTTDQFHDAADSKALESYRKLPYYKPVYEHGQIPSYSILEEGRARENKIGQSEIPIKSYIYETDFHGFSLDCGDTVYINAKGGVLLNADLSYKSQEEFCIGNLNEDGLPHILSTVLYMPRFQKGTQVYRLCCHADAGTIAPLKLDDERYYGCEAAAMGAFHQMIHNLQINPVNPAFGNASDTLRLTIEPKAHSELAENSLSETTVVYTDKEKKIGSVYVCAEHFPLEDAPHE